MKKAASSNGIRGFLICSSRLRSRVGVSSKSMHGSKALNPETWQGRRKGSVLCADRRNFSLALIGKFQGNDAAGIGVDGNCVFDCISAGKIAIGHVNMTMEEIARFPFADEGDK